MDICLNLLIISKEGWFVGLGQEVAWGRGKCLNTLKVGGTVKTGGETEIFKKKGRGQAGSRPGCLKNGGLYVVHASCFSSL